MAKQVPTLPMIDLFSGAGGLSIGLGRNFNPVLAVEIDQDASGSYEKHHRGAEVIKDSIGELLRGDRLKELRGKIALVAGGPPCQPFSNGGLRKGTEDERNCIPAFIETLRQVEPDAFIMENVAGLSQGGSHVYFHKIVRELESLDFQVTHALLNAADYGVPQKRVRLFVVGLRHRKFTFPEPTHGEGRSKPWVPASAVVKAAPIGEPNESIVTYAKKPDLRPDPYDGHLFNGGGRAINLIKPAPTMLASMGGNKTPWIDRAKVVPRYHAHLVAGRAPKKGCVEGARRITVEEAAALQTFPEGFTFVGARSSQYRQIGNAVPPRLVSVLSRALVAQLTTEARVDSEAG